MQTFPCACAVLQPYARHHPGKASSRADSDNNFLLLNDFFRCSSIVRNLGPFAFTVGDHRLMNSIIVRITELALVFLLRSGAAIILLAGRLFL